MILSGIKDFLKLETAGGLMLMVAAVLAMVVANSPLAGYYDALLAVPFTVMLGDFGLSKPVLLWINDGLMAVFFLLPAFAIKMIEFMDVLSDRIISGGLG